MTTLLLVVTIAAFSPGQSGGPIPGSWTAQFGGRTFIRLELQTANGATVGGISLGNIEVDAEGAVKRAAEAPRDLTPIVDVTRQGAILTFARKDGADTDRFELRLLDGGGAELRFLVNDADREELAANGIPVPKPIRLTRQ
jgi:hypothetical protein